MKHGRGGIYRALGNIALAVTLIASASLGPFRQTAHAQSPTPAPQTNPLYIPPPSPTPAPTSQSNPFFIPAPSLTPTATPQVITVVGISVAPGAITGTLALEGTVVVPSPTPATGLSLSLCQGIGTSADGISIGRPVFNPGGPPPPIVHGCGNGKDYVALFAPLERKAIDDLLQTYQLPASDAAELLRWERGLVRAAMFVRFVELVNKGQRTADEQALVSNVAAAAGRLRQEVATHALNEYNKWASNPCAYTPPTGFTYERDLQCTTATSALAGVYISGFRPPTSTEFLSYGLALATNDLGVLTAATMAEAAAGLGVLLGAAVGGAVVAGAVGAAIGAALPLAGLVSVLIPGSAAIAASAAAAAATAAGTATTAGAAATVAGSAGWVGAVAIGGPAAAIVLATAVAVIYTIHVADVSSDAVQAKLVAERDSANSAGVPDPAGLLSTTAGQAQLFAAFVKLTVPEVWEVNATVPAAQAGDGQFLVQASGAGSASYSPTLRYKSWDGSTHTARVSGRWFVVTDAAGRSSRSLDLQYQQPNGSTPTNWVASRVGNRLLHADTSATTASGTLDNRLRFVNPDGQPFEAQIVQNPQAPWIVGTASSSGVPSYLTLSPSATWNSTDGGATRVAVGPDGQPWLVNAQGVVYNRSLGTNGYANGAWQAASSPRRPTSAEAPMAPCGSSTAPPVAVDRASVCTA